MTDNYKLEEYKFAKENIRKNEERRYQMVILAVTVFGVIFSFSDKISEIVIPIAQLTVLMICVMFYRSQSNRQSFTTAYIISEFEQKNETLNYESVSNKFYEFTLDNYSYKQIQWIRKYALMVFNPFSILLFISILCLFIFGRKYLSNNMDSVKSYEIIVYLIFNIIGYLITIYNIYVLRSRDTIHYLKKLTKMNMPVTNNV